MTIKNYIQRYVLLKINSGEWKKNEKLPSDNQLALKFNCSRITARQALIPLVNSGFLKVIKGKGYVVSEASLESNLRSVVEKYDVVNTKAKMLEEVDHEIWNYLEMKESDRYIFFEKEYFDKDGLFAYQKTFLNNEYIWKKNINGFAKSITKELALQGAPITESSIEVIFSRIKGMDKFAQELGYLDRYPIKIIKSFSEKNWIERTVRIVKPSKFKVSYSKIKFSS